MKREIFIGLGLHFSCRRNKVEVFGNLYRIFSNYKCHILLVYVYNILYTYGYISSTSPRSFIMYLNIINKTVKINRISKYINIILIMKMTIDCSVIIY